MQAKSTAYKTINLNRDPKAIQSIKSQRRTCQRNLPRHPVQTQNVEERRTCFAPRRCLVWTHNNSTLYYDKKQHTTTLRAISRSGTVGQMPVPTSRRSFMNNFFPNTLTNMPLHEKLSYVKTGRPNFKRRCITKGHIWKPSGPIYVIYPNMPRSGVWIEIPPSKVNIAVDLTTIVLGWKI